ncbi:MAG: hypothetical protein HYY06_23630 [Deltaproteobacteria bacterium]|nr:hypothetical protein [Deltaproteobacteria bacterium]
MSPRASSPLGPVLDEGDLARIVTRCGRKLLGRNAPPLLTLDEYLWVACSLDRALESRGLAGAEPTELSPVERAGLADALARALHEALDDDFVRRVADRLLAGALDDALGARERRILAELSVAFSAEPVRIVLQALTGGPGPLLCRDRAEWARARALLDLPAWRNEDLADYERYLEARGDESAAARVRLTRERLASLQ